MLTPFGVGAVQASFMGGYRVTSETAGYKAVSDTLPYVKKTTLLTLGDTVKGPVDLKDPENLKMRRNMMIRRVATFWYETGR